jgi:pyruvate-formate lyase-activating enzyme
MMNPEDIRLVYCDADGQLYDHSDLQMAVFDGLNFRLPYEEELVALPPGSDVYTMPGHNPIGIDAETGEPEVVEGVSAVAAFASPAWLRLNHPASVPLEGAAALPLFAYAPLGWCRGRLYTTALRVDRSNRQDPRRFDLVQINVLADQLVAAYPKNRLIDHLRHCAVVYGCRAAQNFFLSREEGPLPTSPMCNARCVACLSKDPAGNVRASHDRIEFVPTPEEIAETALIHINRVRRPVVSFGQGCEGEPLLVADAIAGGIRLIRQQTDRGTINLNTNGSRPDTVSMLVDAGLDAIRLSINSFQPDCYDSYYRQSGYSLDDVLRSGQIVRESGGFVCVNYLVFPGVTDTEDEIEAAIAGLRACRADFVQMRNLNIDPGLYLDTVGQPVSEPLGLVEVMDAFRRELPDLGFGYFNPPVRSLVKQRRRSLIKP